MWVPWHTKIFSAGAYIMHRPAMRKLLQALLPGVQYIRAQAGTQRLMQAAAGHAHPGHDTPAMAPPPRAPPAKAFAAKCSFGLVTIKAALSITTMSAGAVESGVMRVVDLTSVEPHGCQSERVMFSQVSASVITS